MKLQPISAVIITRDAQHTLKATLDALHGFGDVVVYDNGSSDDTVRIAGEYANVVVHTGTFDGFGPTRNRAAELASHDWIFSIDADERPDESLLQALTGAELNDPQRVFAMLRENRFMGETIRRGGWGDEWKRRLYHRGEVQWENVAVHERLVSAPDQSVVRLPGRIVHDAVNDLGDFMDKTRRYAALRAPELPALHPGLIFLRANWAFWRSYLWQLGCLAGWRGLVIAWSNANGVFFKYMQAWVNHKKDRRA